MGLVYSIFSFLANSVLQRINPVNEPSNDLEGDGSILANLPDDIIRRIIPFEKYSFGSLRLISPAWNRLVLEHFSNRDGLLPLEGMILDQTSRGIWASVKVNSKAESQFVNSFPSWERWYVYHEPVYRRVLNWRFSIQKTPRLKRRNVLGNKISVAEVFEMSGEKSKTYSDLLLRLCLLGSEKPVRLTLRYLSRFFLQCSELDFIELKDMSVDDMKAICGTLRNLSVNTFCVTMEILDVEKRNCILELLKHVNTKRLTIRAGFCTRTNLRGFLLEVSKRVLMFSIQQFGPEFRFFGIPRPFWNQISRQMMGNGLDHFKLCRYANPRKGMLERRRNEDSRPMARVKVRLNESF